MDQERLEYKREYKYILLDEEFREKIQGSPIPVVYLGFRLGRNRKQGVRHVAVNKMSPNIAYEFTGFQFENRD